MVTIHFLRLGRFQDLGAGHFSGHLFLSFFENLVRLSFLLYFWKLQGTPYDFPIFL